MESLCAKRSSAVKTNKCFVCSENTQSTMKTHESLGKTWTLCINDSYTRITSIHNPIKVCAIELYPQIQKVRQLWMCTMNPSLINLRCYCLLNCCWLNEHRKRIERIPQRESDMGWTFIVFHCFSGVDCSSIRIFLAVKGFMENYWICSEFILEKKFFLISFKFIRLQFERFFTFSLKLLITSSLIQFV